jgi:hypothetical protein
MLQSSAPGKILLMMLISVPDNSRQVSNDFVVAFHWETAILIISILFYTSFNQPLCEQSFYFSLPTSL